MTPTILSLFALCSTTMASVIFSGGGHNFCDGMICPANTGCSVQSNVINGMQITKRSCVNATGHIVQEEISQGAQGSIGSGSIVFSDGYKTCIISEKMIDGKVNTTKLCHDQNGELRPMTPEEEQEFERRQAEAVAEGRRAAQKAQENMMRMQGEAMRHMQEGLDLASRLTSQARDRSARIGQQARENAMKLAENMRRLGEAARRRDMKFEAAEYEAEARQKALEQRLAEQEAKRERDQEAHERRMEDYFSKFENDFPNFVDDDNDDDDDEW